MYSFAARGDSAVVDEPFYAAYLDKTGLSHPMREEVLASQDRDPIRVAKALTAPVPDGRAIFYQKHMCHHMVAGIPRHWFSQVQHVFLIRHPARVISSYLAKRENPTLEDLGFTQQTALFDEIATLRGAPPLVIDATDIRADPDAALRLLCESLGIPFEPAMLHWPAGPKPFDGAWAPHWYNAVHRSTGFAGPDAELPELPAAAQPLLKAALPHYERMAALRLV